MPVSENLIVNLVAVTLGLPPLRDSCDFQPVQSYYGLSFRVMSVMALPGRVVFCLEGDRPGLYGSPVWPTQRGFVGGNKDA